MSLRAMMLAMMGAGAVPVDTSISDVFLYTSYSMNRQTNPTYTGPLFRVRRESDNAELDIPFVTATGAADRTVISTFLGSGAGRVSRLYDQMGLNNMQSLSPAQEPKILTNQDNFLCAKFEGAQILTSVYPGFGVLDLPHDTRQSLNTVSARYDSNYVGSIAVFGLYGAKLVRANYALAGNIWAIAGGGGANFASSTPSMNLASFTTTFNVTDPANELGEIKGYNGQQLQINQSGGPLKSVNQGNLQTGGFNTQETVVEYAYGEFLEANQHSDLLDATLLAGAFFTKQRQFYGL